MHECKHETKIKDMHDDIKDIKKEVRDILSWKSLIIGGIMVLAFMAPLMVSVLDKLFQR